MAIDIGTSFNIQTNLPIDDRLVLTKAEMLDMNDNIMPSVYLCTCSDDGLLYLYNKSNEVDAETGKFRIMKAEGGALVFTKAEWEALDPKPAAGTQVIISDDTTPGGSENIIDDDATAATDKTWSVSKINSAINSIDFKGEAPANADSAITPGVYLIYRSDDAYPVRNGYLIVGRPQPDFKGIIQEVYDFTAGIMYSRGCWNNTWYAWKQHAYSNELGKLADLKTTDKSSVVGAVNEINDSLDDKANKSYVDDNFVKNRVTTTTFINSNNKVYKQGRMCTATIMSMLLNRTYSSGEIIGYIGNPTCYPMEGIRGLVVQLNSGQASEIIINNDGSVQVGQATSLTPGYWIGNFSWIAK